MKKNQKKIKNSHGIKFAIIGVINTLLDIILLFIIKNMIGIDIKIANIFSTGLTFLSSFILNKKITFNSENKTKKQLLKQLFLFICVTLFGLWVIQGQIIELLSPLLLSILNDFNFTIFNISQENLSTLIAKIIATIFSLTWNFILYKKIVFKKRED